MRSSVIGIVIYAGVLGDATRTGAIRTAVVYAG